MSWGNEEKCKVDKFHLAIVWHFKSVNLIHVVVKENIRACLKVYYADQEGMF